MTIDEDLRPTPTAVTWAVSVGVTPLPFLAVYATLFLIHGGLRPVHPPDITSTQHGELIAGLVVLGYFVIMCVALLWFLNRRRRWPFAAVQLIVLGTAIDFLVDPTRGGHPVAVLLVLTTLVSLFCGFAPSGWEHVGRPAPAVLTRAYAAVGMAPKPAHQPADSG